MRKLVVANRGEIALRVFRACRELGIATVAVAPADDRGSLHARSADETVEISSYLDADEHIRAARESGADAIHPGYGFLAESPVQRRHQKVLEESPALDAELREQMSEAAVAFARAIDYRSAGTAEFMLDGRDFWFLELNGRIQVEHPVTELVTGVDLVREQLRIAQGEPIQVTDCYLDGHAVEVRLYAEDPRTFLPQAGRIERLRFPSGIRVDAGVDEGDEVGTSYDPLLAKLIAHGQTREEALDRLATALAETEVEGVVTNLPFLRWLVAHPALRAGRSVGGCLPPQPARPASGRAPGSGRRVPCGRRRNRAERAHRADAGHGDPRPRAQGRHGPAAPAPAPARGDEDGDAGGLSLRGGGASRPCERGRSRRRRRAARRARGVTQRRLPNGIVVVEVCQLAREVDPLAVA